MSLGSMKFEVNSDTGFVTVGYGAGSSPTFTRVLVGNGTAAAPSYSFTNDSNTGFYIVPAAPDILYFTAAGTNALRFSGVSGNGYVYSGASNANIGLLAAGGITLSADGTNQNIVLSPTGTGGVYVSIPGGSVVGFTASAWPTIAGYNSALSAYTRLVLNPSTDPVLFGTYTDSSNGKIQLANHTTIAGGIGFGTDVTVYRDSASSLSFYTNGVLSHTFTNNGATSSFSFRTNVGTFVNVGTIQAQFANDLLIGGGGGGNENTILRTGGTGQILLGSAGPSLTAKLAGDASCQGLITDGSTTSSASGVPAFGTGDYTAHMVVRATTATAPNIFMRNGQSGVANSWIFGTTDNTPAGRLCVRNGNAAAQVFGNTVLQSGVNYTVTVVRSSGTVTFYLNGVANGSGTLATDYTDTTTGFSLMPGYAGFIGKPLVYNRALSAAEVKALYESGTPATADYNNASNTALNTSSWADVSGSTFSSASGATFTVSRAVGTSYVAMRPSPSPVWKNFTKFRITGTLTLNAGKTVLPYVYVDGTGATQIPITAAGSFSVVVTTPAGGGTVNGVVFTANGDQNYTVSSVSVTPLGLLLAPDAAQAGGGLSWYDTSGNNRTVTLPSTGVSWNVPTSGYYTTTGALNITGGANLILTASTGNLYLRSTTGGAIFDTGAYFLFGTATNSSNGIIQLATHTTIAGGIGFGTDLAIFRSGIGTFHFQTTAGNIGILLGDTGYTMQLGSRLVSSNGELTVQTSNANSLFLKTGGVTALTIDSSLNSTFAGTAITLASATAKAGLRLPHGAAPTAPVNGDIWTTTAGLYVRINGVTVGPLT